MNEAFYIPGIFNYCDRWCKRCAFTARCQAHAMEKDQPENPDMPEPNELLHQLGNHLRDTLEMLQDLMEHMEEETDASAPDPEETSSELLHGFDAGEWQEHYTRQVDLFFEENLDFFRQKEDDYHEQIDSGHPVDVEQLGFLHEALETIRWYQHLIGAKVFRAMGSLEIDETLAEEVQSDANGSAKIALICLQRSADAWGFVARIFPEKKIEIAQLIQTIGYCRQTLETAFPLSGQFHRPGFDDQPTAIVRLDFNPN